jgi:hypothetical protein
MSGQFSLRPIRPTLRPAQRLQDRQLRLLVGGGIQHHPELTDLKHLRQQPILGVHAGHGRSADLRRGRDQTGEVRHRHQLRRVHQHTLGDQVPVVAEESRQRPQVFQLDPDRHREQQRLRDRVVVQQLLLQLGPAFLEGDRGTYLVQDVDEWRQAGFDRMGEQDLLGEGVQGADGGGVEVVQGCVGEVAGGLFRAFSNSTRSRSRSSAPAFSVKVTAAIVRSGTPSRRTSVVTRSTSAWRLAGSGARFDEEGRVGVGPDPVAGRTVQQLLSHRRPPPKQPTPEWTTRELLIPRRLGSIRRTNLSKRRVVALAVPAGADFAVAQAVGLQYGHCTHRKSGTSGAFGGKNPAAIDDTITSSVSTYRASTSGVSGTGIRFPPRRTNQYDASTGVDASPSRARAA